MKSTILFKSLFCFVAALFLTITASAQTTQDKANVIQAALDLPAFQPYFKVKEHPERAQVYILDNGKILKILELEKFGKKVIIGGTSQISAKAGYIEFEKADIKAAFADLVYTYPIENVQVAVKLSKKGTKWTAVSVDLKQIK